MGKCQLYGAAGGVCMPPTVLHIVAESKVELRRSGRNQCQ